MKNKEGEPIKPIKKKLKTLPSGAAGSSLRGRAATVTSGFSSFASGTLKNYH